MNGVEPGFLSIRRIQGYAEDSEGSVFVFVVGGYYIWIFSAARATPAGPEIDEYIFAFEITQFYGFAQGIVLGKVRSLYTDGCSLPATEQGGIFLTLGAIFYVLCQCIEQGIQLTGIIWYPSPIAFQRIDADDGARVSGDIVEV